MTVAIAPTAEPRSSEILQKVKGMWSQMDLWALTFPGHLVLDNLCGFSEHVNENKNTHLAELS